MNVNFQIDMPIFITSEIQMPTKFINVLKQMIIYQDSIVGYTYQIFDYATPMGKAYPLRNSTLATM